MWQEGQHKTGKKYGTDMIAEGKQKLSLGFCKQFKAVHVCRNFCTHWKTA